MGRNGSPAAETAAPPELRSSAALPHAVREVERLHQAAARRRLVLFLDCDGTLAPIAREPGAARVPQQTRVALAGALQRAPVWIVSGRNADDVRDMVGVPGVGVIGNHGVEVVHPNGRIEEMAEPEPQLAALATRLTLLVADIPGAFIERKRFSVVVHDREVDEALLGRVEAAVAEARVQHPEFQVVTGRRVHELRGSAGGDKGTAVLRVLEAFGGPRSVFAVYVGDDTTDEDAFRAVAQDGAGILVRHDVRRTAARYAIDGPEEMPALLDALVG